MTAVSAKTRKRALLLVIVLAAELLLSSLFIAAEAHHAAYSPAPYTHAEFAHHDADCHVCRLMETALHALLGRVLDGTAGPSLIAAVFALAVVFALLTRADESQTLVSLKIKLSD